MSKLTIVLLAATALVAVSGCAKKRPAQLPPPPEQTYTPQTPDAPRVDPNGGIVPGSDADFRRSVTSNTVNFAVDMFDIDPTARGILDSQAAWLAQHPQVRITIEGHCDERGTREYNLALGERRATAVKNVLVALGIPSARIQTISYGKERPIVVGSDEAGYAQNRVGITTVNGG
ncbi:MAG: peptidoglycan-associated lipoprotein Pal [Alphaproteobacteria bacterium]|nr:peptidoglycan-associated lipoprotein Pal [Alphaproteobacteria bacterium]